MRLIYCIPLVCAISGYSMSRQSTKETTAFDEDNQTIARIVEHDDSEDDIWYGPGFYYGIWFENENDYWHWRDLNRGYPPNHLYYDPHQPIYYHYQNGDSSE